MAALSDEEYFQWLYRVESDDTYLKEMGDAALTADKLYEAAKSEGANLTLDFVRETADPERSFEGKFIRYLREMTLGLLGARAEHVKHTRVFYLPCHSLNGFASMTPNGTTFIVLNQEVIPLLGLYTVMFESFISWHEAKPFCRDHTQGDFVHAIVQLAHYASTRNSGYMAGVKALHCPSIPTWEPRTYTLAVIIELLIVLHEFGHIILGHLGSAQHQIVRLLDGSTLDSLRQSRVQEFEADAFAFTTFRDRKARDSMTPQDVAYDFGLLLKFFDLCFRLHPPVIPECEWTHPHPADRWKSIQNLANLKDFPRCRAYHLDSAFEAIYRTAGV
jgi:hypothetical protein